MIQLWDTTDRHQPTAFATLAGTNGVNAMAFAPDGHTLATANRDGSINLHETGTEEIITLLCANTGTPITREEWQHYIPDTPYRQPC